MKVLIVHPRMYVYGGAELLIVRLANYLTRKDIPISILTTGILPEIEADLIGTEIIKYGYRPSSSYMNYLMDFKQLRKGIKEHQKDFDVINLHNFPANLAFFRQHKSVVWMCNEPPEIVIFGNKKRLTLWQKAVKKLISIFDRYVVRNYIKDNVVVSDEFNKERFRRLYNLNAQIINYGIDYEFFSEKPSEASIDPDNSFTILHVGIITHLKNQMESLKTINILKDKIPNVKLILAGHGEGEYFESIKDYIKSNHLEKYFEITGHLKRDEIRRLYHSCNVMIHPVKAQGGWLSPFEAMCAEIPVIVSTELTAASLMKKNNLGTITSNYSDSILDIYKYPDKYREKTALNATWVKENLSWDSFCEKMVEAFHRAFEENNKIRS